MSSPPPPFPNGQALPKGVALPKPTPDKPRLPSLPAKTKPPASIGPVKIKLELELTHWKGGFLSATLDNPRLHASRLSSRQAIALKLLACSLNRQDCRLANGKHVDQTNPDALRYLLDQIAAQIPEEVLAQLESDAKR